MVLVGEELASSDVRFVFPFTVAKRVFLHARTWRPLWRKESIVKEL